MWTSLLAILATLIPWIGRYFGPEEKLKRKELQEVERQGEVKLKAEQLKSAYERIDHDKKTGNDLLDRLNRK